MFRNTKLAFVTVALAGALALSVAQTQDKDIVATASANDQTKTFVKLLDQAGLTDSLKAPGPYTVFVPSDDAFATLEKTQPELYQKLTTDKNALKMVLQYHTVNGTVASTDLKDGADLDTLSGDKLHISVSDQGILLNKQAKIVTPDMKTSNGNIDVIDTVLVPKSLKITVKTTGNR